MPRYTNFVYDLSEDFETPKNKALSSARLFRIVMKVMAIVGLIIVFKYFTRENAQVLDLVAGIVLFVGGIGYVLRTTIDGRPKLKKGQVFLKIEGDVLKHKLNRFGKEKIIALKEVKTVLFDPRKMIFQLKNGGEFYLYTNKIANKEKRDEFINRMKRRFIIK